MKIKRFKGKIRINGKKMNILRLLCESCDYDEDMLEDILDIFFDFNFNIIEILKSKSGKSRKIPLSNKLKEELIKIPRY